MSCPKSRLQHLHAPFRCLCVGKSRSGKSAACYNAIADVYKGCFSKIYILSRSSNLGHTFIMLREWAEKHLGQDNKQERFVFTSLAESSEDIMRIGARAACDQREAPEEGRQEQGPTVCHMLDPG